MEFHEVLGYAVDGLYANLERIERGNPNETI